MLKSIYIGQVLEHNIDTGLFHTLLCTYIVLLSLYNCSMIIMYVIKKELAGGIDGIVHVLC